MKMELPGQLNRAIVLLGHQNIQTFPYQNAQMAGYHNSHMQRHPNTRIASYSKLRLLEYQTTPAVCPTCCNLNRQKFSTGHHRAQFANQIEVFLAHFLATSKLGCPFCELLLQIFKKFVPTAEECISRVPRDSWNVPTKPSDVSVRVVIDQDQPMRIIIREGLDPKAPAVAELLCYNPSEDKISEWPYLISLGQPSDPSSDVAFQFLKDQVEQCTADHRYCRNDDSPALPKRVLDVGTNDENVVKLIESDGKQAKFAALSHRWCPPDSPMLMTTNDTLSKHLENIDWEALPKTVQDAIKIARRIDIRFLWVDTLCIVQDGEGGNDKEIEMAKMGTYYSTAFCTIAASSSKDSTTSFLQDRDEHYRPVEFEFGRERSIIHVRRFGVVGTLANRGWVWQESALSTRVLNFTPSELVWECKSALRSECRYVPFSVPSLGLPQKFEGAAKHPLDRWRQLVQSYSARELTHEDDILPAISGLAQKVHEFTKSQYLAGLWRTDLPWGLLWEVIRGHSEPLPTLPEKYTSPSWSWASIKGQVRTCPKLFGPSLQVKGSKRQQYENSSNAVYPAVQVFAADCSVPARSQNSFGKVTEGFITLNGLVTWATLTCDRNMTYGWTCTVQSPTGLIEPISPDTIIEEFDLRPRPAGIPARTVRRAKVGRQKKIFRAPVLCLLVAMVPSPEPCHTFYEGLVLGRSEVCPGACTRIGFFRFSKEVWFTGAAYHATKIV